MKDTLLYLVQGIALHADDVSIEETDENNDVTFYITCNPEDMGRIIGKEGKVIKSLRRILSIMAVKEGKRIHISMVDTNAESQPDAEPEAANA